MHDKKLHREKILNQFEPDLAVKLLEFAATISRDDTDIFVFMSRKFCCLYDLLLSIGIPPVQKPIVSDKVLDSDTNFFRGKKVQIVDDIIICGTSIWKAKEKLLNYFGASEVKTSVFCVNEKFWVKECIDPNYKAVVLSDERSLTFCASIVSALSIAPRPYAVEFPYFTGMEIKKKYWHKILSSKDWDVYDITNKLQEDNEVSTLTFFPSVTMREELEKSFGPAILNIIDIAKVRVYAIKISWGVRMSILPIITFKTLSKSTLDKIFDTFLEGLPAEVFDPLLVKHLKDELCKPVGKLRFLQYAYSVVLASKFRDNIKQFHDKELHFDLRNFDIELLFGSWNLPALKSMSILLLNNLQIPQFEVKDISSAVLDLESTELQSLMEGEPCDPLLKAALEDEEEEFQKDDTRNIFSDFSNIFLSLYHKKEIPSREAVRKAAPVGDWDLIRKIDRLETGITWLGILKYLSNIFHYNLTEQIKNVLSLVLDYSVDKGICVPVTRYNESAGIVFRAYRHGEDVKFAEEETELCGLAIEKAEKAIGKGEIPKLFLEKLLVLFIRIGASRNILQVQYGTSGQEGIAKIGFYLKGAVVKLKKRNKYNAENNLWLSSHLLEKNVIKKTAKGLYCFYKHYPAVQISSSSRIEAQKFGYILGLLFKGVAEEGKMVRFDNDDLIFLSTCYRPRDVAAALLVELDIYLEDLFPFVQDIYNKIQVPGIDLTALYKNLINNKGYEALNSLHKKTMGWKNNGAQAAIRKGEKILNILKQDIAILDWEAYWASLEILKRKDENILFDEHILKMAELGHRLLFNTILLEIAICLKKAKTPLLSDEDLSDSIEKLNKLYTRTADMGLNLLTESEQKLVEHLKKHVESEFSEFGIERTLKYIDKNFIEENLEVSKLGPTVSSVLEKFEHPEDGTIHYDYVLYYDIVDSTATIRMRQEAELDTYRNAVRRTKNNINNLVNEMQKKIIGDEDEMYCWNGDASSTNDAKYIFFSSSKPGFSYRRVKEFVERLYSLPDTEIAFRVIICPATAFYSKVFKRFQRTEVEGERFWEHYSRIHKEFKALEQEYSKYKDLVLIIGNESAPVVSDNLGLNEKLWSGEIQTVIAANYFKTFGELWTPKRIGKRN